MTYVGRLHTPFSKQRVISLAATELITRHLARVAIALGPGMP